MKLPFLQSQIVESIYCLQQNKCQIHIKDIADKLGYSAISKLLLNNLQNLANKKVVIIEKRSSEIEFYRLTPDANDFLDKIYLHRQQEEIFSPKSDYIKILNKSDNVQLNLFDKDNICEIEQNKLVHEWYPYLEGFSPSLIHEKLKIYGISREATVLDPFCGSGTTLVTCKMHGIDSIGVDANPLMKLVSEVKTTWDYDIDKLHYQICSLIISLTQGFKKISQSQVKIEDDWLKKMPQKELDSWLRPRLQKEAAFSKYLISKIKDKKIASLIKIIMGKALFDASNVVLAPGTCFYPYQNKESFYDLFCQKLIQVYKDIKLLSTNNCDYGKSSIFCGDSRKIDQILPINSVDFLICSPPYPNDLEYTTHTRLELYLWDFANSMNDILAVKKNMVCGSTKLIWNNKNNEKYISEFQEIIKITSEMNSRLSDKNWGFNYPRMVREFFGDMFLVMENSFKILKPGAISLWVVGDQSVKGVLVPVGKLLAEIGERIGYSCEGIELLRVRRSTGAIRYLNEEIVILKKK